MVSLSNALDDILPLGHICDDEGPSPLNPATLGLQAMKHHEFRRKYLHVPFPAILLYLNFNSFEFGLS